MDEYRMDRDYFDDSQTAVIQKILRLAIDHESCGLSESEIRILSALLAQYTKPKRETMKREMI